MLELLLDRVETEIGELRILADREGRLRVVDWNDYEPRMLRLLRLHYGENGFRIKEMRNPHGFSTALQRYFSGEFDAIESLPVEMGGTEFQRRVWQELRCIPCGATVSYGELAQRIGKPSAVRAVGLANGANPIGIVVPCHRVIGANGSLTGYGGGMERKRWLLRHERVQVSLFD